MKRILGEKANKTLEKWGWYNKSVINGRLSRDVGKKIKRNYSGACVVTLLTSLMVQVKELSTLRKNDN